MIENNSYETNQEFSSCSEENLSALEYQEVCGGEMDSSSNLESSEFCEEASQNSGVSSSSSTSTKSSGTSKLTTAVGAIVGVALIAITVLSGSAAFSKFDVYGTSVDFTLETTISYTADDMAALDYQDFDTNLRMITFSSETDNVDLIVLETSSQALQSEVVVVDSTADGGEVDIAFSGRIEGLYEGTKYTTQVVGEDDSGNVKVYAEKSFTTTGAQTFFEEISWECKCRIDGCFYFTMQYLDENGYYGNFSYRMISADTLVVFAEGDIENPTQTQCINVEEAEGMDYILEIYFTSTAPIDIDSGESEKFYQLDVKI